MMEGYSCSHLMQIAWPLGFLGWKLPWNSELRVSAILRV